MIPKLQGLGYYDIYTIHLKWKSDHVSIEGWGWQITTNSSPQLRVLKKICLMSCILTHLPIRKLLTLDEGVITEAAKS